MVCRESRNTPYPFWKLHSAKSRKYDGGEGCPRKRRKRIYFCEKIKLLETMEKTGKKMNVCAIPETRIC